MAGFVTPATPGVSLDRPAWAASPQVLVQRFTLKQYFDVIVQPGLTFSYSPEEGYSGLLSGKTAVLILARGGTYVPSAETGRLDMQRPYLELILGFIGVADIRTVLVQPTQLGTEQTAQEAIRRAIAEARSIAEELRA